MEKYENVFTQHDDDLGKIPIIKHKIKVNTETPIHQRPYTITNSTKKEEVKKWLERMEKLGIIRKSMSPWVSPLTAVVKPNGKLRICGDYRKLNSVTITHAYPLPKMNEELEKYRKVKYFTSLDAILGFWQVEMEESDKEKMTITTQYGQYEFNVMPFGLKNALATFQMLMNEIFREYLDEFVTVYVDDILIYSKTFTEHLKHLEKVLQALQKARIKIKLRKCKFAKSKIKYLGHLFQSR